MSAAVFTVHHFDVDKIADSGQCFRWQKIGPKQYRIPAGDACAVVTQSGNVLHVDDQGAGPHAADFWANYFALADDYAGFWRQVNRYAAEDGPEAYLSRAARVADGVVILHQPAFETIVSFMVSQNNNIPRIRRSVEAMCARFGAAHGTGADAWYSFPEPDTLARADLSGLGLGYREAYIKDFAAAVAAGRFDLNYVQTADYETARAYLKSVRGIGDKVANCVCLFTLGHLAAFPVDTWIRRAVLREFGGEFPAARYDGFAGLIQQFMFYYEKHREADMDTLEGGA